MTLKQLRSPALICAAIFLLCELLCWPFAEMGVADDWSYISIANVFYRSGHIAYNGWASAMVGWQLYIAAFLYKLFGFSFTAPRLGTLATACLIAFLMHRTLVRLGIGSFNAAIGTLVFVLSPLFMMLSATFMTDVPGFFAMLLAFYGCIRALQASSDRASILWLVFAVATNAICGTSRQIAWLGVLIVVPCTLWMLRSRRAVFLAGIAAMLCGWTFVLATLHWLARLPYTLPERYALPPRDFLTLGRIFGQFDRATLTITLLLLPVMALFLAQVRRWPRRSFALAAAIVVALGILFLSIHRAVYLTDLVSPFVGDWVGIHGTYNGIYLNQQQPPILIGHLPHLLLSLLTTASALCVLVTFLTPRPELPSAPPEPLTRRQLLWLFGPFTLVYVLLLLDHAEMILFDRYMLAPIFVLLFALLRFYQRRIRPALPAASVAMLCLLAGWGIVCTHNLFALQRARVVLNNEVLATGISTNAVDLGWDANGWFALQHDPAVNNSLIVNPPGFHRNIVDPHLPVCYGQSVYFGLFPRLAPQYGVAFDPNACAGLAPFAPVSYTSWPDMRRVTLYVVRYPAPWRPEGDYAAP